MPAETAFATATVPVDDDGNVYARTFRPSSGDLASLVEVSEAVEPGDGLVIDREQPGMMRRGCQMFDIGVVEASPGVVLGSKPPRSEAIERPEAEPEEYLCAENGATIALPARVTAAFAGVVRCKVDASYGPLWLGDLLVTSSTPGHAMREESPLSGTVLGNALEPLLEYAALGGCEALFIHTQQGIFRSPDLERAASLLRKDVIFDRRKLYEPARML